MTSEEIVVTVEHVHRTALALGTPTNASEHLGHAVFGVHATSQGMPVISVGGDDRIGVFGGGDASDCNGLLTDVDVAESADLAVLIGLHGSNFELTDEDHHSKPFKVLLEGKRSRNGAGTL
jgi:hypothetical protein